MSLRSFARDDPLRPLPVQRRRRIVRAASRGRPADDPVEARHALVWMEHAERFPGRRFQWFTWLVSGAVLVYLAADRVAYALQHPRRPQQWIGFAIAVVFFTLGPVGAWLLTRRRARAFARARAANEALLRRPG